MHPRAEIRQHVLDLMIAKVPGCNSYSGNRFRQYWQDEELPAIGVYTVSESNEIFDVAPRRLRRTLDLAIEIVLQSGDSTTDQLDELCSLVEQAMRFDETLGGKASKCFLTSTNIIEKPEGEMPTGSAIMTFEVTYLTEEIEGPENLRPFTGGNIKMRPADETDETQVIDSDFDVET